MVAAVSSQLAKAVMLQGTGSNVGKSILVAGLCRAATKRGLRVLPFKPQNMSNNAAVALCDDGSGGEIGRAQWLQALACGAEPHVDMNPVLLKPQSQTGSQIVVHGKVAGNANARDYHTMRAGLLASVMESYQRLRARADIIVVEGAGSPAEINLRKGDIANMGFALEAKVPVVLVGDIDRGGVIASLVGTHSILDERDRERIKGFIINKFRGDPTLFAEGRTLINRFTRWRDFGMVPWLDVAMKLPEEDSVWLDQSHGQQFGSVKIVVPVTGKISNFDDFDPLAGEPDVNLVFLKKGEALPDDTALVVLAGSKSTISDMAELSENGWAEQIRAFARKGGQVIGVCGGYQMLGNSIADPDCIEGDTPQISGLGLLEVETRIIAGKTVRMTHAVSHEYETPITGYEIHLGETSGSDCRRPMVCINGVNEGAISGNGKVRGCYLHGLFANDDYRANLLLSLGGISSGENFRNGIDLALDELALKMERHLDVSGLLEIAESK